MSEASIHMYAKEGERFQGHLEKPKNIHIFVQYTED